MERRASIPPIPGWQDKIQYIDLLNELITAFYGLKDAASGQVMTFNSTNGRFEPTTPTTYLATFSKNIGSFTRNTATATGTQAVASVGFQPQLLLFLACQNASLEVSIGWDDGTNKGSIGYDAATGNWLVSTAFSIQDIQDAGASNHRYDGVVSALGSDGFTISWTRTNTPTGTLTVLYLALRIA